jgi:HEAT repeat protein
MSQSGTPLQSLLGDLASPNYRVRWKAVQDLGQSRDPRALEPLLGMLKDRLPTIRIAALSGLGRLRDRRAIEPVIAMLDDPDSKFRTSAAAALKKFGKAAHAPMLAAYRGGNAPARFVLLGALGRINSPTISELLIAALDDPQVEIRLEAARVLGVRKDRRAVPRLLQAVAEGGPHQCFSIRILGEIGDPRAFEPLQDLLTTREFMLGREVVTALRKIDNPGEALEGRPELGALVGDARLHRLMVRVDHGPEVDRPGPHAAGDLVELAPELAVLGAGTPLSHIGPGHSSSRSASTGYTADRRCPTLALGTRCAFRRRKLTRQAAAGIRPLWPAQDGRITLAPPGYSPPRR